MADIDFQWRLFSNSTDVEARWTRTPYPTGTITFDFPYYGPVVDHKTYNSNGIPTGVWSYPALAVPEVVELAATLLRSYRRQAPISGGYVTAFQNDAATIAFHGTVPSPVGTDPSTSNPVTIRVAQPFSNYSIRYINFANQNAGREMLSGVPHDQWVRWRVFPPTNLADFATYEAYDTSNNNESARKITISAQPIGVGFASRSGTTYTFTISKSSTPSPAVGGSVIFRCGAWSHTVSIAASTSASTQTAAFELADVPNGTFEAEVTYGDFTYFTTFYLYPVASFTAVEQSTSEILLDGNASQVFALALDNSDLKWHWDVPSTTGFERIEGTSELLWNPATLLEAIGGGLSPMGGNFSVSGDNAILNFKLALERRDYPALLNNDDYLTQDSLTVSLTVALPSERIGMLHNRVGELFTAIAQSGTVKVFRFSNGTASRAEIYSLASAKNPTLWWRGNGRRSFEMRLLVQEGALWRVRSSHNGGKEFEMPVTVWSAPYVSATGDTLRNGDEVSVARDGLNVYFRRAKGDDWSAAPVFVGTLDSGSNKSLQVRQRVESNDKTIEITNAFDKTWRSEADGIAGSWVAV